jgi:hypothetical protein
MYGLWKVEMLHAARNPRGHWEFWFQVNCPRADNKGDTYGRGLRLQELATRDAISGV